jgi:hypothetical protein
MIDRRFCLLSCLRLPPFPCSVSVWGAPAVAGHDTESAHLSEHVAAIAQDQRRSRYALKN